MQVGVVTDPCEEALDHAVGLAVLWLASITVHGCLDDLHNVITELQLKHTRGKLQVSFQ